MKGIIVFLSVIFLYFYPVMAVDGIYGPVFKETGLSANGGYINSGPTITVNHYGGNLVLSNKDISIPSSGDFSLFFSRTNNSNYAYDPEEGQQVSHDSPLGHGWNAHLGVLYLNGGYRPTFVDTSGGREIFYKHDHLTSQIPFPTSSNQQIYISPAMSILVPPTSGTVWWLLRSDGTSLALEGNDSFVRVPTYIYDLYANLWRVTYFQTDYEFNNGEYFFHPMIQTISDGYNRTLTFHYDQRLNNRRRLTQIRFNNQVLATYDYQTSGGFTYLWHHWTGENRRTTYTTNAYGMVSAVQYDSGGQVQFTFDDKAFFYFPGSPRLVRALTSMTQKGVTWTYNYPDYNQVDTFPVTVTSTDGWTRVYSFFHYGANPCQGGTLYRAGLPASFSQTYAGKTHSESFTYAPFKISNDFLVGTCTVDQVYIPLPTSTTEVTDGVSVRTDTTYSPTSLGFPIQISSPRIQTVLSWHHVAYVQDGEPWYRLGLPGSMETSFSGVSTGKTTWQYASDRAKAPSSMRQFVNDNEFEQTNFTWNNLPPTSGTMATKNHDGLKSESYQYLYGVLSEIHYSGSRPATIRSVNPIGTVATETVGGMTTSFQWDLDGRLTQISRPNSAITVLNYTSNTSNISEAGSTTREVFDAWGRPIRTEASIQNGVTAVSEKAYDANDRVISEILPGGLTYQMTYDVNGRITQKDAINFKDDYVYSYATTPFGDTTVTTTKNNVLTTKLTKDILGRSTRGSLGSHESQIIYSGNNASVRPDNQPGRSLHFDLQGRKIAEFHPEIDFRSFYYTPFNTLAEVHRPDGIFTYTYDVDGRPDLYKKDNQLLVDLDYHGTYDLISRVSFKNTVLETPAFDGAARPTQEVIRVPFYQPAVAPQYPVGTFTNTNLRGDGYFRWAPVPGQGTYELSITNGEQVLFHRVNGTQVSFEEIGFIPNTGIDYQWRVRFLADSGEPGGWSPWRALEMTVAAGDCDAECVAANWHKPVPLCYGLGYETVGTIIMRYNNLLLCPNGSRAEKSGGKK